MTKKKDLPRTAAAKKAVTKRKHLPKTTAAPKKAAINQKGPPRTAAAKKVVTRKKTPPRTAAAPVQKTVERYHFLPANSRGTWFVDEYNPATHTYFN